VYKASFFLLCQKPKHRHPFFERGGLGHEAAARMRRWTDLETDREAGVDGCGMLWRVEWNVVNDPRR